MKKICILHGGTRLTLDGADWIVATYGRSLIDDHSFWLVTLVKDDADALEAGTADVRIETDTFLSEQLGATIICADSSGKKKADPEAAMPEGVLQHLLTIEDILERMERDGYFTYKLKVMLKNMETYGLDQNDLEQRVFGFLMALEATGYISEEELCEADIEFWHRDDLVTF